jgi:uncharacterized protein (DUF302 family)
MEAIVATLRVTEDTFEVAGEPPNQRSEPREVPGFVTSSANDEIRLEGRMTMTGFGMRKKLHATYDEALSRVPEALESEGFGVLTEIDIRSTFEKKLGVDFRRYKILGACNPPFAHAALQADVEIGLMLPCNVVIYEDDDLRAVVLTVDPTKTMAGAGNPKLVELAEAVKEKLSRALAKLEG